MRAPKHTARFALVLVPAALSAALLTAIALRSEHGEQPRNPPAPGLKIALYLSSTNSERTAGIVNRLAQQIRTDRIRARFKCEPHRITYPPKTAGTPTMEHTPFAPLLSVKTTQPGILRLKGTRYIAPTAVPIPANKSVHIHPNYLWDQTCPPYQRTKETLTLTFTHAKHTTTQTLALQWSAPREIFLSDNCLPHLSALISPAPPKELIIALGNPPNIAAWMTKTVAALAPYAIHWDDTAPNPAEGWQSLRRTEDILRQAKANCLELSMLWAELMIAQDLKPWLYLLPGHALVGAGHQHTPFHKVVPLETTLLTGKGLHPANTQHAINAARQRLRKEPNVRVVDILFWKDIFYPPLD